ncbi:MAG: class I SAM-dependent methyltransferase [Polynucleobacter sp.]|nr:class I SAM-dependent methyltransferase [Polynucleobacter sp.]
MALKYVEHRKIPEPIIRWVVSAAQISGTTRVLDVGTGTGHLANSLASVSSFVTGLDISEHMLSKARATARDQGVNVSYILGDANTEITAARKYDVVTLCQALHWLNPDTIARSVKNVLCEQGCVLVIASNVTLPLRHPLRELFSSEQTKCVTKMIDEISNVFEGRITGTAQFTTTETFLFEERRPIDLNYAQAYHSRHRAYWRKLSDVIDHVPVNELDGDVSWFGVKFSAV